MSICVMARWSYGTGIGDLFANIAKANNVHPVKANVIPQKVGFAA